MSEPTLEQGRKTVAIRYIGNKPKKLDNIAKTETEWKGFGDVQEVSQEAARLLLVPKYSAVWQLASSEVPAQNAQQTLNIQGAAAAARKKAEAALAKKPKTAGAGFDVLDEESIFDAACALAEEDPKGNFDDNAYPKVEAINLKTGRNVDPAAVKKAWDLVLSSRA